MQTIVVYLTMEIIISSWDFYRTQNI